MWHLHDCSQVTLVGLFPDETDTTVLKWDWYDGSQVTLGPMLPIDVVTIVPKWHWHDCSQADFDFLILFCFLVCSLARFFTSNFHLCHVPGLSHITQKFLECPIVQKFIDFSKATLPVGKDK